MADKNLNIRSEITLGGEKEYKKQLDAIGIRMKTLGSELKLCDTRMKTQGESVENLKTKQAVLTEQLELQRARLKMLGDMFDKHSAKYGENSQRSEELKKAIADTSRRILELENSMSQCETALKDYGEEVEKGTENHSRFRDVLSRVGSVMGSAVVAGAKAAAAALTAMGAATAAAVKAGFEMASSAGTYADDLLTLSTQTGVSAQELQKWSYAANFIDTDVNTITGSMARMTKAMGQAANGSETSMQKFTALGVSIYDANGRLRDSEAVFMDAIDALGGIANETERDAMAMELFGKSAQELNPLIEAGGAAMAAMGSEAKRMGTVFSDEALSAMGSFDDSMQRVKATGEAVKNSIGLVLIPAFQPLVDTASNSMAQVATAMQDGLQAGELEGIITTVIADIETALSSVGTTLQQAVPVVSGLLTSVVGLMSEQLPGLVGTLLPAAMNLLQSVLDGLMANVEPITMMATNLVTSVANFLITNAPAMATAATGLIAALVSGISTALPDLLPAAADMVTRVVTGLAENLPTLLESGADVIVNLVSGLTGAIPKLIEALPQIISAITDALLGYDWLGLGMNLLQGLVNGLKTAADSLLESIKGVFSGIWQAILGVFGIASPSTEAQSAARFILDGLVSGFESAVDAVCATVKRIFGKIWDAIKSIFGFGSSSEESKEAKQAGKDIMTGMQEGIAGDEDKLKQKITSVSKDALATFRSEFGIDAGARTSTKLKTYGQAIVQGIIDGIEEQAASGFQGKAYNAAHFCAQAFNREMGISGYGFSAGGAASKFEYIGQSICAGIANGIESGSSRVSAAARSMAQAAYNAAKSTLGIRSPSTKFAYLADMSMEGYTGRLNARMVDVKRSVQAMNSALQGSMPRSQMASGAIDYDRLAAAMTQSMVDRGLGVTVLQVDGKELGRSVEPGVSVAQYKRSVNTVSGRAGRLVIV